MNVFGDPINFKPSEIESCVKGVVGDVKAVANLLEAVILQRTSCLTKEENTQIKEIKTLVKELFYEVTYVYYYIKRNLKPEDHSRIKKLVTSRINSTKSQLLGQRLVLSPRVTTV